MKPNTKSRTVSSVLGGGGRYLLDRNLHTESAGLTSSFKIPPLDAFKRQSAFAPCSPAKLFFVL